MSTHPGTPVDPNRRESRIAADSEAHSDPGQSRSAGSWRVDSGAPSASPWFGPLLHPSAQSEKLLLVLFGILAVAFSIAPLVNEARGLLNKDYDLWYQTGQIATAGGVLYPDDGRPFPFMYPPSCAAFLAVITLVAKPVMVVGMVVVTSLSWLFCIAASVSLATGRVRSAPPLLYLVPSLAVIPFIHDMYLLGQPVLLLLALLLGAFLCLRHRWPVAAGLLIAVAAAIKAYPVLALGYLVYRRLWRATAAAVVALALMLVVLPVPIRGPAQTWTDLTTWVRGMVLKYDSNTIAQRPERSYSYKNQGLVALANRLLRQIPADGEAKDPWSVGLADLDFKTVNAIILATSLGLGLFFLASLPRDRLRTSQSDATEQAMLLLMVVMFNPLCFNYSYVWLIYPLTCSLWIVLQEPRHSAQRRSLIAWSTLPIFYLAMAIPFLREAQAYGNAFFAGLIVLVGLAWQLRRMSCAKENPGALLMAPGSASAIGKGSRHRADHPSGLVSERGSADA